MRSRGHIRCYEQGVSAACRLRNGSMTTGLRAAAGRTRPRPPASGPRPPGMLDAGAHVGPAAPPPARPAPPVAARRPRPPVPPPPPPPPPFPPPAPPPPPRPPPAANH